MPINNMNTVNTYNMCFAMMFTPAWTGIMWHWRWHLTKYNLLIDICIYVKKRKRRATCFGCIAVVRNFQPFCRQRRRTRSAVPTHPRPPPTLALYLAKPAPFTRILPTPSTCATRVPAGKAAQKAQAPTRQPRWGVCDYPNCGKGRAPGRDQFAVTTVTRALPGKIHTAGVVWAATWRT